MKRFFAVILSLLVLGTCLAGCASEKRIREEIATVERYSYPIDISSVNWFDYTVSEKSEMLRIPQETLDEMSDLQLLFATADYPYFIDATIYGYDEAGFAVYGKYCTAFGELLSRKSFQKSLKIYGEAVAQVYLSDQTGEHYDHNLLKGDLILSIMKVYLGYRPDETEETKSP